MSRSGREAAIYYYGIDGRTTIIPVHSTENIGTGIINKIIKDAKITRDDWIELIKNLILF